MTAPGGLGKRFARGQLQQWGTLAILVLLLLGIALFILLVMLPDIQRRTEYEGLVTSLEQDLALAQQSRIAAPAKLQARLDETKGKLTQLAQAFLTEAEATAAVNRLYTYADEAGVEIVNLQAAPAIVGFTHTQRDYKFQVTGLPPALLNFLGRIDEVTLPGFVVSNVAITPNATTPTSEANYLLTMNVSVLTSPYTVRMIAGQPQEPGNFATVGDLPLAEIQRQVELAWTARDWDVAIGLLEHVVEGSPENESARTALYRAHMNNGYHYLSARNDAAAKAEFEAALLIRPDGKEAVAELQQMAQDINVSHSVEDQLRQEVENARAAGNWQEVIRLLRIIAAVDPEYGPVGAALTQAYINYGNQLALAGDTARAEEQYQLAQYPSPQSSTDGAIAATQPMTGSAPAPAPVVPIPTPLPLPTETPTPVPTVPPTPSPIPTAIPPPTATPTPIPSNTPTATPIPSPTATPIPSPTATTPPTATQVPTSTPTTAPTATSVIVESATATTSAVPLANQALPATPTYVVQQGDTLYSIAQSFGTTVEALRATNGLANDNIIPGQVLFITTALPQPTLPSYLVHVVAPNDTLFSIAQRYGTTVDAIMAANGLNSTRINVGQTLHIPVPISLAPVEHSNHA